MLPPKRVLSVGQCGADHHALTRTMQSHFAAEIVPMHTHEEALTALRAEPFDLVLVNRITDADGTSGLELVKQLRADESLKNVPVMLVSNHEDAQRAAVEAGAVPGFGKAALGQPAMLARMENYLELLPDTSHSSKDAD